MTTRRQGRHEKPWGKYTPDAPQKSQERFGLKIIDVSYDDFGPRVQRALADAKVMATGEEWVRRYLALPHTRLKTERKFVVNAFVLYRLFKEMMREHEATAFTIKSCRGTILPMAQTTACLTLSLLNEEGLIAFYKSDFVIIPAGLPRTGARLSKVRLRSGHAACSRASSSIAERPPPCSKRSLAEDHSPPSSTHKL